MFSPLLLVESAVMTPPFSERTVGIVFYRYEDNYTRSRKQAKTYCFLRP